MLCLRLNGAEDDNTKLVDFSTAISVLDADGKEDIGKFETNQFHAEWSEALRIVLRVLAGGGGGTDSTKLALNGSNTMTGDLPFGGRRGVNLADPINPQDADTKAAREAAIAALHFGRLKVTTIPQMQALTTATIGDDCYVSTNDSVWLAVTVSKYSYGLNCVAGVGVDWLLPIDRLSGQATLVAGHAFVYIPGIPAGSIPRAWYTALAGNPGIPLATLTTNGINIDSNDTDGSTVGYEVITP
jgi:hypothetical protein